MSESALRLDPITRGWAIVTSAGVVRLGLGLAASLLIARAFGPAGYGVYAILAASVAIVSGVAEGGFTEAAVLRISAVWPGELADAAMRARSFFWLRLVCASAIVALGCLAAEPISRRVLNLPDDGWLLRWALLGVVATALSGATSAMLQARRAFGRMSSLTLVNTGLTAALALALSLVGRLDLLSALVVLGIGTSIVTFWLGWQMVPRDWTLPPPTLSALRIQAAALLRTGRWLWVASMCAMLALNLDLLVLNRFRVLAEVGAYALALSLATKLDLVNHSLYTVLLPGLSVLRVRGDIGSYLRRGLFRSAVVCVLLLVLAPLAEPLIILIYGADFAPAAGLFRLLLGVVVFDVLTTPVLLLPLAYQQPRVMAAADALRALTLGGVALALVPAFGAPGAVAARFAARLTGALLVIGVIWRAARDPAQKSDRGLSAQAGRQL